MSVEKQPTATTFDEKVWTAQKVGHILQGKDKKPSADLRENVSFSS